MESLSGQSFIPSNLGHVNDEEMLPTARGTSHVYQVSLSTALTVDPGTSRLDYRKLKRSSSRRIVALPSTVSHALAGGGGIMLWETFSWMALRPLAIVEQTRKAVSYLNIIEDQLHPYMESVFVNWKCNLPEDNVPCHKAGIVLDCSEKQNDEFLLMS
ncbi:transposable element Tcb2 transposase [Trichonephila clavipes]|uniref:Transposable element Tcb2 transposase n=1 Tax=Trichonephila clavipes TaxID=2585209 RepID=A0A8X6WG59_TRICX|nr:transposable element Tcb2 transposase [Trichonephila clavipes]